MDRPRRSLLGRIARPVFTATTMVAVVAMAIVTSVPANALVSTTVGAQSSTEGEPSSAPAQRIAETQAAAAPIHRDGYTAQVPVAQVAPSRVQLVPASAGTPSATVRWPFDGPLRLSDGFGPRVSPCSGCSTMHPGTDFLPGSGSPVYSVAAGVVRAVVSSDSGLGVHVIIEHVIDGSMVTSTYAHMQFGSVPVSVGQTVAAGTAVGRVGNTGASTGPHLHFEIRPGGGAPIDPYSWLRAHVR